jgi:glycosyltransferase involved in cell wall biosynthesis
LTSNRPLIAVDLNPAVRNSLTGTEVFAVQLARLLPEVAPELGWTFYASRPQPDIRVDLTVLPMSRLWSQVRLPLELLRSRPRLLFSPSHVVPFASPVPALTVVHDLAFERFPNAYSTTDLTYLRLTTAWAERRCPILIAVSESTRRDLVQLHGLDPARVQVVNPGGGEANGRPSAAAADSERLRRLGITEPFALHVGRIEPRKNQLTALAAVERAGVLSLVCAGRIADEDMAARLRASPLCSVLGEVDSEIRDALYRRAVALVFPSLYEGFGFPVLEAMRSGLPVVTVNSSSLPEVGGDAALYASGPDDVDGLAMQLRRLAGDAPLRRRLARAGRQRAATFTWRRCAEGVAAVIRSLLERSPQGSVRPAGPS